MAYVRARRSGTWSDTNATTTPWGTGGAVFTPSAGDVVILNGQSLTVDVDITNASTISNHLTSVQWKDNLATSASTAGGSLLLNNNVTVYSNIIQGDTINSCVGVLNDVSAIIVGNIQFHPLTTNVSQAVNFNSIGTLNIIGDISAPMSNAGTAQYGVNFQNVGNLIVVGNVTGGLGTNTSSRGIYCSSKGFLAITGNVTSNNSVAVETTNSSVVSIIGSIKASATQNGFISSHNRAINRISGNLINHSTNGIQAVYAYSYLISPVPVNGVIQDVGVFWPLPNPANRFDPANSLTLYNAYSLSAFSMPAPSAVRLDVEYANSQLKGALTIPIPECVLVDIPVDHTVGRAAFRILDFFNVSVAKLTAVNSIGNVLGNLLTTSCVGETIASWD